MINKENNKISDEQLDNISGGGGGQTLYYIVKCSRCKGELIATTDKSAAQKKYNEHYEIYTLNSSSHKLTLTTEYR